MKAPPFTYSGISKFITCPAQYAAEKVLKYVKFTDTEATLYGTEIHKVAELYIQGAQPIPEKHSHIKPYLDALSRINGDKYCELELGIKKVEGGYVACEYSDAGRYWRGIADLVVLDEAKGVGYVVDYKTGKSAQYADTKQLGLLAAALFVKYPQLKLIKGMLLFLVSKEIVKEDYTYEQRFDIFNKLKEPLMQRDIAYETGVFNAKPTGFCNRWCMAVKCLHNGRYEGE